MARRRRSDHVEDHLTERPRDPLEIAIETPPMRPLDPINVVTRRDVLALEDRRLFHPEREFAPPGAFQRSARRVVERAATLPHQGPLHLSRQVVAEPGKVAVCVRREERRQVLFAKGRSGGGNRKPRWSEKSYDRCK